VTQRHLTSRSVSVVAGLAALFLLIPLVSVIVRVPWWDAWGTVSSGPVADALFVSLQTSLVAAVLSVVFGVPVAWWLAQHTGPVSRIVRVACVSPIVLPPVVGGIALLAAFGRRGLVGQWLYDWWGVSIPFTRTAVVMAQLFVAMPFLVIAVEAAFRQSGTKLEEAARTLGAGPLRIFFRVSLPSVASSIMSGAVLAWARSFGEFGASITFAGSFPGRTQTLPMSVYEFTSTDYPAALVVSVLMIAVSVAVLVGLRDRWLNGAAR